MEVCGQLHVPIAVFSVPIEQEARWAPESVCDAVKRNFFFTLTLAEHYIIYFQLFCFTFTSLSLHFSAVFVECQDRFLTTCGSVSLTDT